MGIEPPSGWTIHRTGGNSDLRGRKSCGAHAAYALTRQSTRHGGEGARLLGRLEISVAGGFTDIGRDGQFVANSPSDWLDFTSQQVKGE
jgi:hypothetical protein